MEIMKDQTMPDFIVIDDDPINNIVCRNVLQISRPGSRIQTFTDPEAGLEFIRSLGAVAGEFEAILFLDLNMPVLTGWDVLKRFEKLPDSVKEHVKIFILSSSVDIRDKQRASTSPLVLGFIEKPLTMQHVQSLHAQGH
jgi:CheY-like chemotaxis protein